MAQKSTDGGGGGPSRSKYRGPQGADVTGRYQSQPKSAPKSAPKASAKPRAGGISGALKPKRSEVNKRPMK